MGDLASLDMKPIRALAEETHKTELVIQGIKMFVINNVSTGQLSTPAPILTRVFHEIDTCVAKFREAEKLSRVPFPTPYGIMMHVLMAVHTLITPPMMISVVGSNYQSALCAGIFIFVLWSVHLLAGVLENPFNSGSWDIDLEQLQRELNEKLTLACAVRPVDVPFLLTPTETPVERKVSSPRSTRNAIRHSSGMRKTKKTELRSRSLFVDSLQSSRRSVLQLETGGGGTGAYHAAEQWCAFHQRKGDIFVARHPLAD